MISHGFAVVSRTVEDGKKAADNAYALVHSSQWFEVCPLPDDVWQFSVKAENKLLIERLIKHRNNMKETT